MIGVSPPLSTTNLPLLLNYKGTEKEFKMCDRGL